MSAQYNFQVIRELLNQAFSDSDISTLAFDRFDAVYQNFTTGMTKGQMIALLLDWVRRQEQVAVLLAEVKERNLYQYERYAAKLYQTAPSEPTPPFQPPRSQDS